MTMWCTQADYSSTFSQLGFADQLNAALQVMFSTDAARVLEQIQPLSAGHL